MNYREYRVRQFQLPAEDVYGRGVRYHRQQIHRVPDGSTGAILIRPMSYTKDGLYIVWFAWEIDTDTPDDDIVWLQRLAAMFPDLHIQRGAVRLPVPVTDAEFVSGPW